MLDILNRFIVALRAAGLPVSMTEHLDAAEAIAHIDLGNREHLRSALKATLVKDESHFDAFDLAFEIFFAVRSAERALEELEGPGEPGAGTEDDGPEGAMGASQTGEGEGGGGEPPMSEAELNELVDQVLRQDDTARRNQAARQSVDRFSGIEPGRPVGGTYYLFKTLRALDLEERAERLLEQERERRGGGSFSNLEERLTADEIGARIAGLKKAIEAEIRRRLVEDRGSEALAKSVRKPLPEDVDVMHATREELIDLEHALRPLSRKLAVRLARKRRHKRKGSLDFRQTVRHSLSTGGVPIEPRFKNPRPAKPEIMVIADVSGSVASFARFTLHLVYAIAEQFSKVRAFVFVDGIDEVTHLFDAADDPMDAVARINSEANVVYVDGHSDYGHALKSFHEQWAHDITGRTSVLILGDARSNYHASESWVVADLQHRARHVYWLNPEPYNYWGSGDSIVKEYGQYCDQVVEVRTLRQLERFVGELA